MSNDQKLQELPEDVVAKAYIDNLRLADVTTANALWKAIGEDYDAGIEKLAERCKMEKSVLRRVLTSIAADEAAKRKCGSFWSLRWVGRLWPEALFVASVVGLVVVARKQTEGLAVVVTAPAGLTPLTMVTASDIALDRKERQAGSFDAADRVTDHYMLTRAAIGSVLHKNDVSIFSEKDLRGRTVLSLTVEPAVPPLSDGETVSLLFSARGDHAPPHALVVDEVRVLDLGTDAGDRIAFAVLDEDVNRLGSLLGDARTFVLRRPARTGVQP
jgi:hypothetical protein